MATRKSDAAVGPIGVWAYNARTSFKDDAGRELQPQAVAPMLPSKPNPATIRKIESNPNYHPEEMVRELFTYYRMLGEQRGIYVPQPPLDAPNTTRDDQAELYRLLARQTDAMESLVERLDMLLFGRRIGSSEVDAAMAEAHRIIRERAASPETSGEGGLVEGERRGRGLPGAQDPAKPVRSPRRQPHDAGAGRG